jgi:hypothetical protein
MQLDVEVDRVVPNLAEPLDSSLDESTASPNTQAEAWIEMFRQHHAMRAIGLELDVDQLIALVATFCSWHGVTGSIGRKPR